MHGLIGERILMRIYLGEADKHEGAHTYDAILKLLRERHLAGATVFRGSMSFGANAVIHTDRLELMSLDLPIVIECVETEENLKRVLPDLDGMIGSGLITLERANVITYRAEESAPTGAAR